MIYLANDKYRAVLRNNWIDSPPDGSISVSAVPDNVPTLVVVGWNTDFETVFSVQGKAGSGYSSYALTGVTRLRGYDGVIPEGTSVNCLNNMEFINQYLTFLGIEWKGEWEIATAYLAGEGVSYEGSSYIALVDTTGDEPPADGIWQLVTLRGATWTHGEGAPNDADGIDGDFYLDELTDDVYSKTAGSWGIVVNIKGEQGIQGIQGIAATITVGTVTTGAPGSPVTFTNVGDENDAIFDISIPEGEQGEQGIQGIQGEQGIQGDPGISTVDATSLKNATLLEDTTNTDTYAGSFGVSPGSYFVGLKVNLKVTNANTGASTLNVNSLGAKSIKKNVIDDVAANDIKAGQIVPLIYDGTNFQIVGGGGGGGADVLAVQVFS
jgi:hypothetical protein